MRAILADDVMAAIARVREHFPDLRVDTGACDGSAWHVDFRDRSVIVDGNCSPNEHAQNLLDALDALCAHYGVSADDRRLRLVRGQRRTPERQARTGT